MTKIECVNPEEIEEGDLIAYLHGDAEPRVGEHIIRCTSCAGQVEQLRIVDAQLLAAFYRDACPAPNVLGDFALNQLPAAEKLRVAAHVRGCPACSEELAAVRGLTDEEPPPLLARLQEALALALIARPVTRVAVPARGISQQGRFEVEDVVVTLSIHADSLTGRVRRRPTPPDAGHSGQAWLLGEGMPIEEIPSSIVDERGHFWFPIPAAGSYTLLLQVGEQDVVVENVQVA